LWYNDICVIAFHTPLANVHPPTAATYTLPEYGGTTERAMAKIALPQISIYSLSLLHFHFVCATEHKILQWIPNKVLSLVDVFGISYFLCG
jgi:hypothetical protein